MSLVKPVWPILQRGNTLSVGLQLAWPIFEGSGNRTQDLSGKENDGTLQNTPSWGGGPLGSVLSFNGSNQAVVAAKTVDFSGDFSMGGWFLYNIGTGNERSFTGGGDNTPVFWHANANFGVVHGGTIDWTSAFVYSTGVWYRIWLTRKGNTATIYVNGVQKDQNSSFTPTYGSNTPALGADIGGSFVEYWSGRANDPRIYNRAISAAEVSLDYLDSFSIYRPKRRVPWFTISGGTGTQNLSPSLFTNTQTFFSPTVGRGAVNLTPSLFTNTSTFFAPTVSSVYTLTPSLFTNPNTFYSPTVTSTYNLTPSLFTNNSTFFSAAVTNAGNLAPSLFTNSNTFFSPTVGRGVVNLAPTLFTNSNIFYSPTVAVAQPQALLPSLYTNPNTFFLPVVRSHIVLLNVHVKLKAPHVFDNTEWPAETIFGPPDGQPVPSDFQYTPLMEGLSSDSIAAIAQTNIDVFGRYDAHGNLLDNPPIPRPIYDPQPTPAVGDKHFLPLGNGSWP